MAIRRPVYELEAFARRLRETREERRIDRTEFAHRVGVSRNAVWGWETHYQRPRPELLAKIASVLGVTEAYLMSGSDLDDGEAPLTEGPETIPEILEDARKRVALASRVPVNRVRVSVEFLSG